MTVQNKQISGSDISKKSHSAFRSLLILIVISIVLNLGGSFISHHTGVALPLDTLGTMLTAVLGGYLPGMIVGFLTNIIQKLCIKVALTTFIFLST